MSLGLLFAPGKALFIILLGRIDPPLSLFDAECSVTLKIVLLRRRLKFGIALATNLCSEDGIGVRSACWFLSCHISFASHGSFMVKFSLKPLFLKQSVCPAR